MEVNQLLQEVERFEGIVILTTNLDTSMDRAFSRRVQFRLQFPSPGPEERAVISEKLVPPEAPCRDVDFKRLGRDFEISGGYIKNAVLRAAYHAQSEGSPITEAHLVRAAELECKSAGRLHRASGTKVVTAPSRMEPSGRSR
jgi:SpoVK/Ycf46/Vps4 family AAA+-type ATPase